VLSLPANYREAVVLCDLHEMDYAQASGVLGVPLGTLRSRLHRGRALLMEKMRVAHAPGVPRSQSCERLIGNQVSGQAGQGAGCGPGGPPHNGQSVRVISNDA
jgi:hypothetical protein